MTTLLEDARALARTGNFENVSQIEKALVRGSYTRAEVDGHLYGKAIRSELIALCREARELANDNVSAA